MSIKLYARILAALLALAGMSVAQEQSGPTKDTDTTVAKPRN